ncbi:MFS transporter [Companilactobacillus bobalius]|uniref:Protein TsgA like protein n=3 Tax=Companilactobacillus bobalius TaxID=2801451 RepID=A0A202FET2_9LACO|nr:MFS transporter [Companilactobacillus bobalius]OVE98958.1 Protein TsgA like protein [Companilactobacillus bobalius]GEO56934.1 MFS transporter [Companilactobacillus paralimentarius]
MKSTRTTISILSLSTVSNITTVITGVIPQLRREFPNIPTTMIEWLVTIANFSALLTILPNPFLSRKLGIKKVVIIGLLISATAGIIPAFSNNFLLIMCSRFILGLGVGLFSPHAISLIAHNYSGEFRAKLLGYQTGLTALGNAILLGLAGLLVGIWHAVFGLYLILIFIAILIGLFVPEPEKPSIETKNSKVKLPWQKWQLIILTFITYLLIWGVQLKLPSYFEIKQLGNPQIINLTLSAMNLGGLVAGLLFGTLHKKIHRFTLTMGYLGATLTVLILWATDTSYIAITAAILFNFVYSFTGPYLVFASNQGLEPAQINSLSSYLTVSTIISAFFAPLIWNYLGNFGPQNLTSNVLLWITVTLFIISIITIFPKKS